MRWVFVLSFAAKDLAFDRRQAVAAHWSLAKQSHQSGHAHCAIEC
jgi:hypothetical protein